MKYTMEDVAALAGTCISMGKGARPELQWLKGKYDYIKSRYHLRNKTETDRFLYERMYGREPQKDSDYLKIRYWRTGKYMPGNRTHCMLFGKALELSDPEMEYLLQWYCDRGLTAYDADSDRDDGTYHKRMGYLKEIIDRYLGNIPKQRLDSLRIPENKTEVYFRHLYFTDALRYVDIPGKISQDIINKHITSLRYESELARQMRLCGEIPRKVFIRHLIILGMPDLTLDKLNRQLEFFGYLPLHEEHTMVRGERLDWLLIRFIKMYEEICGEEADEGERHEDGTCQETYDMCGQSSSLWFQEACRTMDAVFREEGVPRLRFMHFKALNL